MAERYDRIWSRARKHLSTTEVVDAMSYVGDLRAAAALLPEAITFAKNARGWMTWQADIDAIDAWLAKAESVVFLLSPPGKSPSGEGGQAEEGKDL